jgi:hypothetical protein
MSWGQTRLLTDYVIVYLYLITKTTKNRKGLSQESKTFKKLTLDPLPIVDWPASTVLSIWRSSLNTVFFMPIGRSSGLSSADRSDLLVHCQGWTLLTIGGSCWLLCSSLNRRSALCFSFAASPYLFLTLFFQKNGVNTHINIYLVDIINQFEYRTL